MFSQRLRLRNYNNAGEDNAKKATVPTGARSGTQEGHRTIMTQNAHHRPPLIQMIRSLLSKIRSLSILGRFVLLILIFLIAITLHTYHIYLQESRPSPFLASNIVVNRGLAPPPSAFVFPTPQERVRYYMGVWYNNTTAVANDVCSIIPFWKMGMKEKGAPYLFDHDNLQQLQFKDWPYRLPWRFQRGESADAYRYHFDLANITDGRMLMQFGDGKDTATFLSTPYPLMVKARLSPKTYQSRFGHAGRQPILGMYAMHRHYDYFHQVDQLWDIIPWPKKTQAIVWRGSTAGTRRKTSGPRKKVVEQYFHENPSNVNVGFTYTLKGHDSLKQYIRPELSVTELLSYKYLLILEGWGLASGLKWMLYSNSVVFMAEPTKVSWAMEDKLVPFVHFIPLKDDFSDLLQQLEWARNHDQECQIISRQARHYMEELVTISQPNTLQILKDMGRTYQRNFGSTLNACNVSKVG